MVTVRRAVLAGTAALFVLTGTVERGVADDDHERARRLKEAGDILPLERIIEEARRVHPGRILEAELETKRGSHVYEVEMVDDQGAVRELRFDARTGKLLQSKEDD